MAKFRGGVGGGGGHGRGWWWWVMVLRLPLKWGSEQFGLGDR